MTYPQAIIPTAQCDQSKWDASTTIRLNGASYEDDEEEDDME